MEEWRAVWWGGGGCILQIGGAKKRENREYFGRGEGQEIVRFEIKIKGAPTERVPNRTESCLFLTCCVVAYTAAPVVGCNVSCSSSAVVIIVIA